MLPRGNGGERVNDAVARHRGEKADASEVDAKDGDLATVQLSSAAQQRTVTPEGDEEIDRGRVERLERHRRHLGQLRRAGE